MDGATSDDAQALEPSVTIPAAFVGHAAGSYLQGSLRLGHTLVATLSWADVVPQNASVAVELWTNRRDLGKAAAVAVAAVCLTPRLTRPAAATTRAACCATGSSS